VGLLNPQEVAKLHEGLRAVEKEWEAGKFEIKPGDEDIHTANERRLTEIVGAVGGKLHTGRSRNDQVVTDVRLWMRDEIKELKGHLRNLISTTVERAERLVLSSLAMLCLDEIVLCRRSCFPLFSRNLT
jgi:argininosuccinate lyase